MSLFQTRFLTSLEGIRRGRFRLTTPEGHHHNFGTEGPEAEINISDWALLTAL